MTTQHAWFARLVAAAVLTAVVHAAAAPAPQDVRISVDVLVLDDSREPVTDLRADEIEVLVDDQPARNVTWSAAPASLSVVLLADVSMSQPLKRYEIQNGVAGPWLQSLRPGDRARVVTIGGSTVLGPWLSGDRVADAAAVRALIGRGAPEPSPLWDAVDVAVQGLAGERGGKALVLITDGRANANVLGLEDAAARAISAGVSVSVVSEGADRVLPQGADEATRVRSDDAVQWLAEHTGGLFLPDGVARRRTRAQMDPFAYVRELAQTPNRPGPLLAQIMSALQQRYRLSFEIGPGRRIGALETRARRPGTVAHAPRVYRVPAGSTYHPQ